MLAAGQTNQARQPNRQTNKQSDRQNKNIRHKIDDEMLLVVSVSYVRALWLQTHSISIVIASQLMYRPSIRERPLCTPDQITFAREWNPLLLEVISRSSITLYQNHCERESETKSAIFIVLLMLFKKTFSNSVGCWCLVVIVVVFLVLFRCCILL